MKNKLYTNVLPNRIIRWMLFISCFALTFFMTNGVKAQLSGTINIPGGYPSLDAAITDLNAQGVAAGGVTLNLLAGNPQTAPVGGYIIGGTGSAVLTSSGVGATITIQGNGNTITAATGLTAGKFNDGIIKLVGADYVTIDNFVLRENVANLYTPASPPTSTTPLTTNTMTEWGIALLYATSVDGAQHNTIQNNDIYLRYNYPNSFGIYSNTSHTPLDPITTANATTPAGSNSFNKFYGNYVEDATYGIVLIGSGATAALNSMDNGNDIGGTSALTGNTFFHVSGTGEVRTTFSLLNGNQTTNYVIWMNNQYNNNCSYNTITAVTTPKTPGSSGGIENNYFPGGAVQPNPGGAYTTTVEHNTIDISCTPLNTTIPSNVFGISTRALTAQVLPNLATYFFRYNVVTVRVLGTTPTDNSNLATNTLIGFQQAAVPEDFYGDFNTFKGFVTDAPGAAISTFSNFGAISKTISMTHNSLGDAVTPWFTNNYTTLASANCFGVGNNAGNSTAVCYLSDNDFYDVDNVGTYTGTIIPITNAAFAGNLVYANNKLHNISVKSGGFNMFQNGTARAAGKTFDFLNNSIVGTFTAEELAQIIVYNEFTSNSPNSSIFTISGNNFSNIITTGNTNIFGLQSEGGDPAAATPTGPTRTVTNNTLSNWVSDGGNIVAFSVSSSNTTASNIVSGNLISNINGVATIYGITSNDGNQIFTNNTVTGITTSGSPAYGIGIFGGTDQRILKNNICGIQAGDDALGMLIQGTSPNSFEISNNVIGNITAPTGSSVNGIRISASTPGFSPKFYYNTIHLTATSSAADFGSNAIIEGTAGAVVTMNNNILSNASTANGTGLSAAFFGSSTTFANYAASSDRNDFFAPVIYSDGTNTFTNLPAYKTYITAPRDANSVYARPQFISTTCGDPGFLHVNTAIATSLESGGSNIAGITDDYDADVRQGNGGYVGTGTAPDIGADEFNGNPNVGCAGAPTAGTINGVSGVCVGLGTTLSLDGASEDVGITYQWASGTSPGGPYTTLLGTGLTQATGPVTVNTYYVVTITCTNPGGSSVTTAEKAVLANPIPSVSITPSITLICNPGGGPSVLTASGASTYVWSPSAGLSANTGSVVNADPPSNRTYVVSGTSAAGCTGTASVTLNVSNTPGSPSASATPPVVCSGAFSNLDITADLSIPSTANTYSFSASSGTFTSLSGGTPVAALLVDDAAAVVPIGFDFTYEGVTYSLVAGSSNGFLSFTTLASGFNNSLAASPIRATVSPLWDDLSGAGAGAVASYLTTGTAGTRVFTFEWLNWRWDFSNTAATISFQAKLYEADGKIEFIYRQDAAVPTSASASIGLSGVAVGDFLSLNNSSASPVASSVTEFSNIQTKPATDQVYTFTPPVATVTYSWSPGAGLKPNATVQNPETPALPPNSTTIYTVTVTNNGCTATATTSVTSGAPLVCSPATTAGVLCSSSDFTVTANYSGGGAPYSFAWSDGVGGIYPDAASITANLAPGTYTFDCVVSDNCGGTCASSVTVTVNPSPSAIISPAGPTIACSNSLPLVLTASTDIGNTYQWKKDGTVLSGETNATLNVTTSGSYTVEVTITGACSFESAPNVVTVNTQESNPTSVGPANIPGCYNASISNSFTGNCLESVTQSPSGFTDLPVDWTDYPTTSGFNTSFHTLIVSGFPAGSIITDVSVSMDIAHTYGGDLRLDLQAPNGGPSNVIFFDPLDNATIFGGGGGTTTLPYVFNNTGTVPPTTGAIASPGPYAPFSSFSSYNGFDPNGTWTLTVRDPYQFDGGIIDNVVLTITVLSPTGPVTWYSVPSGGTPLATITPFNPISNGGASTATPGAVYDFYAECSANGCPSARQHVTFTVGPNYDDGDCATVDACDPATGNITHTPGSCSVTLNSNIYIQGYYSGGGLMEVAGAGTLFIDGVAGATATDADTISISAMDPTFPYALVQEAKGVVQTNGSISVTFTAPVVAGNSYYLRLLHRNSVETWSAAAVPFSAITSYPFSTAAAQAFAGNQADLGDGNFAIFTGDINHDGAVDGSDFLELDPSIQNGDGGYAPGDLNGDGAVDGSDFLVLDPNIQNGIGAALP